MHVNQMQTPTFLRTMFTERTHRVALLATVAAAAFVVDAHASSTQQFTLDSAGELASEQMDGATVLSTGTVTRGARFTRSPLEEISVGWSMATDKQGIRYVGTGSEGRVFAVRGGAVRELVKTGELVVSALALGSDGTLFAGTLPHGKIFAISTQSGESKEFASPEGAKHIWALHYSDKKKTLYAATGPEGKVFAIDAQGRAEVYWDSNADHVMALSPSNDGLLAGTDGDAIVVRITAPGQYEVLYDFPGNEITTLHEQGGVIAVGANKFSDPPPVSSSSSQSSVPRRAKPGEGLVFRISPDGRVEALFKQEKGHVTAVHVSESGSIFAGLGVEGRVVKIAPDGTHAIWADVEERQIMAMDFSTRPASFVTNDGAALYREATDPGESGTWTSKVLDAKFPARFGELGFRGKGRFSWQTRTGNTEKPDASWTPWSALADGPGPVKSPAARYLQVRLSFSAKVNDAALFALRVSYLPQNQRARIGQIRIKPLSKKEAEKEEPRTKYTLTWEVNNPDDDTLRYAVEVRSESQSQFRSLLEPREELTKNEFAWETGTLPDGFYIVRVTATDTPVHPSDRALSHSLESEPLLVDNHSPTFNGVRFAGGKITGEVTDSFSHIDALFFAVDGGEFEPLLPIDDLLDTKRERFSFDVSGLESGEHVVAIMARDAAKNSTTTEIEIRR